MFLVFVNLCYVDFPQGFVFDIQEDFAPDISSSFLFAVFVCCKAYCLSIWIETVCVYVSISVFIAQ